MKIPFSNRKKTIATPQPPTALPGKSAIGGSPSLWMLSWISLLLLILSLLAIAALGLHFFILHKPAGDTEILVFSLLAGLFITEKFQSFFAAKGEERVLGGLREDVVAIRDGLDIKSSELMRTMEKSFEMKCVGSHTEAFRYVVSRLHGVDRMKDTFFRVEEDQVLSGHADDTKEYMGACLELMKRGGSIEFIFSKVNHNIALAVAKDMIDYVNEKKAFIRWQGFELQHGTTPVINLIVLTYRDYREVLFGWNYSNTDDGLVFSSTDDKVVRYFDALYDRMRGSAKHVIIERPAPSPAQSTP
jgi:hypothetical protein